MILKPQSKDELSRLLSEANFAGKKIARVELSVLDRILEHTPEDMTSSVESGLTLGRFQEVLRQHGQWLPIDPPGASTLAIADLLAEDLSGPRRFGYGTIRDYLIGISVALADGTLIKAGGKVVKNVAGYDLAKLFIGAQHSLGIVVEAVFKLRPLPEKEIVLQKRCATLREAGELARSITQSPVEPVVLDLHNRNGELNLVVAFAGFSEDIDYQVRIAGDWGVIEPAQMDYDNIRERKASVLPSETIQFIEKLGGRPFVARLGNGIVYYEGDEQTLPKEMPHVLMNRIKTTYDPKNVLPEYRA